MIKQRYFIGLLACALFVVGCQNDSTLVGPTGEESVAEALAKVGRTQVWADGILFNSVVTPGTFKPESDPFDQLYAGSFLDGIGLISDAKPGDQDYNGGRWSLNVLKEGVDPAKYAGASSYEELDPADFESAGMYFECPLQPIND